MSATTELEVLSTRQIARLLGTSAAHVSIMFNSGMTTLLESLIKELRLCDTQPTRGELQAVVHSLLFQEIVKEAMMSVPETEASKGIKRRLTPRRQYTKRWACHRCGKMIMRVAKHEVACVKWAAINENKGK